MGIQFNRLLTALVAICFLNVACFNSYLITTSELEKLQSGNEADQVLVSVNCNAASATYVDGAQIAQADDVVAATSGNCETVEVSGSNALEVLTNDGESHRVTPFNFSLGNSQLVAADYDLLLQRNQLAGAEVQDFSAGKTVALILGVASVAVGSFLVLSLTAPEERGLGGY